MSQDSIHFLYLIASVGFILALQGLSSAKTSIMGNRFGNLAMLVAVVTTLVSYDLLMSWPVWLSMGIGAAIGLLMSETISMTALPQLVAAFHSLVGLAAVCVALAAYTNPAEFHILHDGKLAISTAFEMGLGSFVGALTFSGSIIAFMKLQGILKGRPLRFTGQHFINALFAVGVGVTLWQFMWGHDFTSFMTLIGIGIVLGFLLILPIGGADMPVIVSMLNSYSGWAAAGIGFTLQNPALLIVGALVGSSGAILSYIMCKAMNRSFLSVVFGGVGAESSSASQSGAPDSRPVKSGSAEDAAFLMKNAQSVIIVPGYGMAVAQSQHALREMADQLKSAGVNVRYAIHPVAGRMPGHMNVLLAEANVPYEEVFELENINNDFAQTDVAFVIGANDVTNPAAKTDPTSPIYGMPILEVEKAKTILFVKRSMAAGYAGVENEIFYKDQTMMLFGDAKKVCEDIVKNLH